MTMQQLRSLGAFALAGLLVVAALSSEVMAFSTSQAWAAHRAQPTKLAAVSRRSARAQPKFTKNSLVMMPTSTPMVPYQPPGQDYAQFVDINTRLMQERILVLGEYIDEAKANGIICTLLYMKKQAPNEKISLYVNCPGGQLRPALAVYDTILQCRAECEISTLNLGMATGMGALICGAGTKGMRSSMPNARYLLQRIGLERGFEGQASDIGLEVKNVKLMNDRLEKELAKMTGQAQSKVHQDMQRDFYLSSEEAVRYGLIDNVLLPRDKGVAEVTFTRDPWTGAKVYDREEEVNLGSFQSDQRFSDQGEGGGWGSGWKGNQDDDDEDDDEGPKTQK
jgi:ATP-dependent Clp protease protease subunit